MTRPQWAEALRNLDTQQVAEEAAALQAVRSKYHHLKEFARNAYFEAPEVGPNENSKGTPPNENSNSTPPNENSNPFMGPGYDAHPGEDHEDCCK